MSFLPSYLPFVEYHILRREPPSLIDDELPGEPARRKHSVPLRAECGVEADGLHWTVVVVRTPLLSPDRVYHYAAVVGTRSDVLTGRIGTDEVHLGLVRREAGALDAVEVHDVHVPLVGAQRLAGEKDTGREVEGERRCVWAG